VSATAQVGEPLEIGAFADVRVDVHAIFPS
jgi:hypothetical protein